MSAAKAKGTRWESAIVAFLRERGLPARRVAQEGFADSGDIHGVEPVVIQAKDWKATMDAIREGLNGAEKQARIAGEPFGVAVVKRARKPVGDAYAVMTLSTLAALLTRLRAAERT